MAMSFHTINEMADILGVTAKTLNTHCKTDHGMLLKQYVAKHRSLGVMSIRRRQFQSAMEGNTTMLRWMGIQYLGQSPRVTLLHKVPPSGDTPTSEPSDPDPEGFEIDGLTDMDEQDHNMVTPDKSTPSAGNSNTHALTLQHNNGVNDGSVVDAEIVTDED